jgi:hypothetical protein
VFAPKGFSIDKALVSASSMDEKKALMGRLVIGDIESLVSWGGNSDDGVGGPNPAPGPGAGCPQTAGSGQTRNRSQLELHQEPGGREHVAKNRNKHSCGHILQDRSYKSAE